VTAAGDEVEVSGAVVTGKTGRHEERVFAHPSQRRRGVGHPGFKVRGGPPAHNNRWYIQDLEGGSPKAITPEGYGSYGAPVSPDGKLIVASCPDLKPCIVPVAGGPARSIPSGEVTDSAIQWSQDGRYLYIFRYGALPTTVWQVDIVSGKRTLWKSLAPSDLAGVGGVTVVVMTRDTRVCLYSYMRIFSDLFSSARDNVVRSIVDFETRKTPFCPS